MINNIKNKYQNSRKESVNFLNKLLISIGYPDWNITEYNIRRYKEFLLSKKTNTNNSEPIGNTIKGGFQEVTPNPSPTPADEGEWGTPVPNYPLNK
jgi:hypothetical protein